MLSHAGSKSTGLALFQPSMEIRPFHASMGRLSVENHKFDRFFVLNPSHPFTSLASIVSAHNRWFYTHLFLVKFTHKNSIDWLPDQGFPKVSHLKDISPHAFPSSKTNFRWTKIAKIRQTKAEILGQSPMHRGSIGFRKVVLVPWCMAMVIPAWGRNCPMAKC